MSKNFSINVYIVSKHQLVGFWLLVQIFLCCNLYCIYFLAVSSTYIVYTSCWLGPHTLFLPLVGRVGMYCIYLLLVGSACILYTSCWSGRHVLCLSLVGRVGMYCIFYLLVGSACNGIIITSCWSGRHAFYLPLVGRVGMYCIYLLLVGSVCILYIPDLLVGSACFLFTSCWSGSFYFFCLEIRGLFLLLFGHMFCFLEF